MLTTLTTKTRFFNLLQIPKKCWHRVFLTFFVDFSCGVTFFLSWYFIHTLKLTYIITGTLISCFGFGTIFGGFLGGKLSDLINPQKISIISLFLLSIGYFLMTKFTLPIKLAFILFSMGIARYTFATSNNVWSIKQCRFDNEMKMNVINILYTASNLGTATAGLVFGLFAIQGFSFIFYLASLIFLISAIFLLVFSDFQFEKIKKEETIPSNNEIKKHNFKIFFLILFCLFLVGIIIKQRQGYFSIYLKDSFPNISLKEIGYLFAINPIMIVLLQMPLVSALKKFNKIKIAAYGSLLMGCGLLILNLPNYFYLAICSCVIYTFGEMLFFSVSQFLCFNNINSNRKGEAIGWYKTVYAASAILGPIFASIIYQHIHALEWFVSAIISLLCFLVCLFYQELY